MNQLFQTVQVLLRWIVGVVTFALFISIWIVSQWLVGHLVDQFQLSGIDKWSLVLFQWLFAIGSLIPVATYILKNSLKSIINAWKDVKNELTIES